MKAKVGNEKGARIVDKHVPDRGTVPRPVRIEGRVALVHRTHAEVDARGPRLVHVLQEAKDLVKTLLSIGNIQHNVGNVRTDAQCIERACTRDVAITRLLRRLYMVCRGHDIHRKTVKDICYDALTRHVTKGGCQRSFACASIGALFKRKGKAVEFLLVRSYVADQSKRDPLGSHVCSVPDIRVQSQRALARAMCTALHALCLHLS